MKRIETIIVTAFILWTSSTNGFTSTFELQQWKSHAINSYSKLPDNVGLEFAVINLDHFNTSDNRLFELRYLYNEAVYKPGGPIFLFVGGQEPLFPVMINSGPLFEIAKEHGGLLLYPEIRYAGLSRPFKSLTMDNLLYNTIAQSIEDLADLLRLVRAQKPELRDAKVVLAGAGYGGSLATYFRARYPSLSVGAWISSAPLEAVANEPQKRHEIGNNFRTIGGDACYEKIRLGFEATEKLIAEHNTDQLVGLWKLCYGLDTTNPNDVNLFMHTLYTFYINLALATEDYVRHQCVVIINTRDNVQAIAIAVKDYLSQTMCVDTRYDVAARTLADPNVQMDARAFFYTVCKEVGQWSSGEAENQPLGTLPKFDFYVKFCNDLFHLNMTRSNYQFVTRTTNLVFGGKDQKSTNMYFTHGTRDPNRVMGIQVEQNPSAPVEFLSGAGFAEDLYYFAYEPTEVTTAAQIKARDLITEWLK